METKEENKQVIVEENTVVGLVKSFSFLIALPIYWHVIFMKILGLFDLNLFIFIVIASALLSYFNMGWGLIDWLVR